MKITKKEAIITIIIILALFSRLVFLDIRPLHSDESVNYFFAKNIIENRGYSYDSTNYHGPFYFFMIAFSFFYLGISEFSLRLPAALAGIIIAILPLFLKFKDKSFENYGKYFAAIFIVLSPSIVYYSRYSIHESFFILFSFLSIYFLNRIIEERSLKNLPYFMISLALILTIKETTILLFPVYFFILLINFKEIKKIKLKRNYNKMIISILIFLIIYILFFTSFFTNLNGFNDSFKGYLPWTDRGLNEKGHDKPFYYYTLLFLQYELPLFILGILGLFFIFKSKSIFLRNIAVWFILIFLIYSFIPYKTPWLIINITLPLAIISAFTITGLKEIFTKNKAKSLLILILAATMAYLLIASVFTNFINPYKKENKFAYVHTDKDILNLVNEINLNSNGETKHKEANILILSKDYWPLPFYLRDYKVSYLEFYPNKLSTNFLNYDFI